MRIAIAGCGFWAWYQIAAWKELPGVDIVAAADPDRAKCLRLRQDFSIPEIFDDVGTMLQQCRPDALDIISSADSHAPIIRRAVDFGIPIICQKPLTPAWDESKAIVALCARKNVPLFVHENWRYQSTVRKVKELLDGDAIGKVFRSRITCSHAFPIFENQPALKELEQMVIADLGIHLLDTARFFHGEAEYLYAQVSHVTPGVRGEEVATVMTTFHGGCTCIVEMSVATKQENPHFPQTLMHLEGTKGVISVKENYSITIVTDTIRTIKAPPDRFSWINPDYAVVHSSIYHCNKSILDALRGDLPAETTGADNLETLRLTYAAYASAKSNSVIHLKNFD